MSDLKQSNLFYLFISNRNTGNLSQKQNFKNLKNIVNRRFSFSKYYPIENVIQIIQNSNYGIKQMLAEKRTFNYSAYFRNGKNY